MAGSAMAQTLGAVSAMLRPLGANMTSTAVRDEELRHILTERRREIEHDVRSRIRQERTGSRKDVRDALELADVDSQGDIDLALLQIKAETLVRIDQALVRLDAGKYGACVECAGDITERRLRALPFAGRCQACEERREEAHGQAQRRARQGASPVLFPDLASS